jgi:hypothetical protein
MPKNFVITIKIDDNFVVDPKQIDMLTESFLAEAEFYFAKGSVVAEVSIEEYPDDEQAA